MMLVDDMVEASNLGLCPVTKAPSSRRFVEVLVRVAVLVLTRHTLLMCTTGTLAMPLMEQAVALFLVGRNPRPVQVGRPVNRVVARPATLSQLVHPVLGFMNVCPC